VADAAIDLHGIEHRLSHITGSKVIDRLADIAQNDGAADRQGNKVDMHPLTRAQQTGDVSRKSLAMIEKSIDVVDDQTVPDSRQRDHQLLPHQVGRRNLQHIRCRRVERGNTPLPVDQDHAVADRFHKTGKRTLQYVRCRGDLRRRIAVETAVVVERNQHMRIPAMMRHDHRLARRLQPPIGKAADEVGCRYALWFLCRCHHAPLKTGRSLSPYSRPEHAFGLEGINCPPVVSGTAPLRERSDQSRLAAAQRVDPCIGLPDMHTEQAGKVR